jgi:hypothetical protein
LRIFLNTALSSWTGRKEEPGREEGRRKGMERGKDGQMDRGRRVIDKPFAGSKKKEENECPGSKQRKHTKRTFYLLIRLLSSLPPTRLH